MEETEEPKIIAFRSRDSGDDKGNNSDAGLQTQKDIIAELISEFDRMNKNTLQRATDIIEGNLSVMREIILHLMIGASEETLREIAKSMDAEKIKGAFGDVSLHASRWWYEASRSIIAARHDRDDPHI